MLPVTADTVRLFLHVLAAAVWVGGQLTLGAVVGAVRPAGAPAVHAVARRFQLVAWPAFAVLLATGVWNLAATDLGRQSGRWLTTLLVKLAAVAASGAAAALHVVVFGPAVRQARAAGDEERRRRAAAASGACEAVSVLGAAAALLLGVQLG